MLGNTTLMTLPKVGFLSSRKVPPAAVMKCYDSAAVRNRFILETAQRITFAALDPGGSLVRLLGDVSSSQNIISEVLCH